MSRLLRQIIPATAEPDPVQRRLGATLGRVISVGVEEQVLVDFEGNNGGPLPARRIGVISDEELRGAQQNHVSVVLVFENGEPTLPLILSLGVSSTPVSVPERVAAPVEARVDGRRVVLEAEERIELRCGDAAIELRADGTIKLRGRDIKSLARRRQRIAGGTVDIN